MRVIRLSAGPPTLLQEILRMLQAFSYKVEGVQSTKLCLRDLPLSATGICRELQVFCLHVKKNKK